ncbi:MAG: methylated-DNA--[protein]-cysteine S-methyltransferase [Alphaproteobacteria bacterium]|nr:methylated-DNA--[protein]-cysteine S-methyltransferase [Alphaproteobacteria bacterium]MCB9975847.1 methylated-DNA--[protein]-cysteine S-methyltransferase [Rhodospirillales bacterium]
MKENFKYRIIAESIDYLVAHYKDQPDLTFLAERAGYEVTHFQKLFKKHVGISPKRLIQYMNIRHARELLRNGVPLLDAALDTGLSGLSRLHDLFVSCEGITPGQVQGRGKGLTITYGFYPSVIGEIMIARTERGLCWLGFLLNEDRSIPLERAQEHWPAAAFLLDDDAVQKDAEAVMKIWSGQGDKRKTLKLDLYGTNFQIQVWKALMQIPSGTTITYQDIARRVCSQRASRAVGKAVGANPISLLIPCHRVIRSTGIIDNYAWGGARKKLILALEQRAD